MTQGDKVVTPELPLLMDNEPDHDAIRRYARLHHGKRSPCGVCRKRNSGLGIKCGQRPYCEHWNLFKVTSSINGKGVDQSGTSSKPVPDQSHNAESDDGEEGAAGDTECHGDKESEGPDDADADAGRLRQNHGQPRITKTATANLRFWG
ncbi:uncharacterized protein ATNIH1004_005360 [Aspergillus tanneri]|uniref:Uncharacterized protein n=1 Tax=Aspergillus tanneri TaxID=1220188 RepID=A0A5M9MI65_9EURO|nr:uncharacterized protein ATNIH1004_005360 [Aspergillus tanneri]KAA8646685.1 hypothetical protein ATNIH1004_005360 [Aspergillus tanneri]